MDFNFNFDFDFNLYTIIYFIVALFLVAISIRFGLLLPDIDLAPPIPLKHRSAYSHGPFVALAVAEVAPISQLTALAGASLLIGMALHLAYDMYPVKWGGVANISFYPIPYRLPGWLSFIFLWATVGYCVYVASVLVDVSYLIGIIVVGLLAAYKYVKSQTATVSIFGWRLHGDIFPLATTALTIMIAGGLWKLL